MCNSGGCTRSRPTSDPPCWSNLLFNIHPSLKWISSKSIATMFGTSITPSAGWNDFRNNQFLRHGGRLQCTASWIVYPTPENQLTLNHTSFYKRSSRNNSIPTGSRIPLRCHCSSQLRKPSIPLHRFITYPE